MKRVISKHGRERFIERIGYLPDDEMMFTAIFGKPGYTFVWRPEGNELVLVTVLCNKVPKLWLLTPAQLGAETIDV